MRKIDTCEPNNKQSFTAKKEKHEPSGFSYLVVRSDRETFVPFTYRGEDAVYTFPMFLLNHEREMREDITNKRPLVMTNEDCQKHRSVTECHICNKTFLKDLYCDSMTVYDPDSGKYIDHDHMAGKYRGAAHNDCNFKLKLNPKTVPIPVIFHNLKGYDGHLLMQAMDRVHGEIKCIPTNTENTFHFHLEI